MKLTIGIPVYNGEKHIEQTLRSVLNASFNWDEVEVIVSDNNSSDKTCEIVSKYSKVKLFRHNENLGYDKNVDRIFQYASGDYVWTIGADDILITSEVGEISHLVNQNPYYSVIFVGESSPDHVNIPLLAEDFLEHSNFQSGFLSNNIINREMWLEEDRSDLIGCAWIHFVMVFRLLKKEKSILTKAKYISEIEESKDNKSWAKGGRILFTGLNLVEAINPMASWGYQKPMVKRAKRVIKDAYPKVIFHAKRDGFKSDMHTIRRFIKLYREFPSFWVVDFPVLLMPNFLIRLSYVLYLSVK